ncbi:carboxypeptidase D isoform X1 [Drosophila teissieri]|uniref:carboxypeptidase D isoform X1 n=2 Tax=Drosophila teissieri TaxID=7243 RepID=UPI001CBA23A3|nr:carboxypeptidase D isoform X1 [Drosophila teissieri]
MAFDHSQTRRRPTMILRTPLVAGHQLQLQLRLLLLPSVLLILLHLLLCDAKTVNPGDAMQMQHHQMTAEPGLPEPRAYMPDAQHLDFVYHDHEELTRFLRATSARYPNLTALYSIGKSIQGRDLWVMVVSSSPYEHMVGKPDVKYVGNIHGNEPVGREMLLHLIQYFVTSYSSDQYVKWLLDNTRIHILPTMNPDGYAVSKEGTCDGGQGRYNARGFDLNRNFPDYFKQNNKRGQPETDSVKDWISKIQFVLSGSLHGGALVASYPYDNTPNSRICRSSALCAMFQTYSAAPSLTPDDDVFKHLSLVYARNHAKMSRGVACKSATPAFENGITNGAAWYPLTGGMQDYNYVWYGCMEITLEISCCKFPPAYELKKYWEDNQLSLIKFLAEAHRGVQGFVFDPAGMPIERASIKIKGRDVGFQTTKYGEFWRILLPGYYKVEVFAEGFAPREVEFVIVEQHPTLLNVTLQPSKRLEGIGPMGPGGVAVGGGVGPGGLYRPIPAPQHYRPPVPPYAGAASSDSGIFSTISNGLNSLYSNIFG